MLAGGSYTITCSSIFVTSAYNYGPWQLWNWVSASIPATPGTVTISPVYFWLSSASFFNNGNVIVQYSGSASTPGVGPGEWVQVQFPYPVQIDSYTLVRCIQAGRPQPATPLRP